MVHHAAHIWCFVQLTCCVSFFTGTLKWALSSCAKLCLDLCHNYIKSISLWSSAGYLWSLQKNNSFLFLHISAYPWVGHYCFHMAQFPISSSGQPDWLVHSILHAIEPLCATGCSSSPEGSQLQWVQLHLANFKEHLKSLSQCFLSFSTSCTYIILWKNMASLRCLNSLA